MNLTVFLAVAGLLDLSLSFLVEIIAFLAMIAILARWVYPRVIAAAEGRQRQIAEQLEAAEKARQEAEQRLKDAGAELQKARGQGAEIIEGANRLAEQLRADGRAKAEEDARRIAESARREIEAERQKALDSVRAEVADLVVSATERVIGESLDITRQRQLVERAISEVTSDGRGRG
ncbi:MAG: ATP synthase F0 subunit B [Candidatus Nephthysia bennettiae]|uniref:ATP synthase subunit b n=1 Tax=Candidatus Nephthysia bennettiae TaxID=3127016 RepID=A0A934KAA6_9BACT|nr:F0F1 ATP synthase subunit B [Candidatus Dormibacteraeota bacterium]MBJ7614987.1 F0F1 ATP synthase subunit B [Candidatus Dormibacteraeota bacterium]PZR88296.1 MAG: ATP synthase F0 subunit B [Candidatus Dormibacteraeota bacterium]